MEIAEFRDAAREFLAAAKASGVAPENYGAIIPPELHDVGVAWQRHLHEQGFSQVHWPKEYGGRGLSRAHHDVMLEEAARADTTPYLNLQGLVLAGESILKFGTDAQKERFLKASASGEIVWCQLFSEPNAGSDLASLQSRAELDGERYLLNGQKVWCSNGQIAQFGILVARTDPDAAQHKGISFFLLDMSLPGIEVRPLKQMTGDQEFCEVFFTDVEMPADALLGPAHEGWMVAMSVLSNERGSVGAGAIAMERRLDDMKALSKSGLGAVDRDRLAGLVNRGSALIDLVGIKGNDPAAASILKLAQSDLGYDAAMFGVDLLGPEGMVEGDEVERLLYAPGMRIAGGSSEIQRNIIGERILGLPREPRPAQN